MTRASAPVPVARCEACRRYPAQIRIGRLAATAVPGVGQTWLCTDIADCRRHWPVTL